MKKRTIYITLFLIFIIGVISLIGTFAIDSSITEGNSSKADYLFNITLGDRTNREITIPSYDSKIVDIKISNPNEFNISYLLYLEGINSNISIINISDTEASGVLNSKNTNLIKVFIQNNSSSDITTSIKDIVGFEKEKLSVPSNNTSINKGTYYKAIVKSNNNTYGKVKPNIKLSTKNGTVKYNIVPNTGYKYKSTTCDGTVANNILTISNITNNVSCEVVFEPIKVQVNFDLAGGVVETTYTEPKEHTYMVLYNGTYKLETWGAQGGTYNSTYFGGYGGYSTGTIFLEKGTTLYVNVGGKGSFSLNAASISVVNGGYNGGGDGTSGGDGSYSVGGGSGGGATHIATAGGLLSSLSSSKDKILIVASGGGGAEANSYNSYMYAYSGANGGGISGNNASGQDTTCTAGNQTSGSAFGIGGNYSSYVHGASGGGGGYYGGTGGGVNAPGCGGSGYIGDSQLTKKYMYCYNCATSDATDTKTYTTTNASATPTTDYAKSGDGAARVTLISDTNYNVTYKDKYGELPTPTRDGYTFDGWYTGENGTGTKVTSDTLLTNEKDHTLYAKWIKDVKVTFDNDNNIFSASSNSMTVNGLSINYDPSTSYLTLNGTPTSAFIILGIMYNLSFVEGEKYALKTTYISGSYSNVDSNWGCFTLDVKNSSNDQVSIRNYADLGFNANYSETVLTINSVGISEGDGFISRLYFDIPSKWTFTNYTVKLDLTKIESKIVKQSQQYGTLPTPTRDGYTFDGWYTGENGTGTKVTSDTLLTNEKDHTLYAKWIKDVKVTFDNDNNIFSASSNSMTVNGLSINYDPSTSYLTLNGTPTSAFIILGIMYNLSFVEGEKYALKTTYISGSYSNVDSNWGCFTLDVKNSSNDQVSIRNYADLGFNANYSETVLTINSVGISEGDGFISRLYFDIPSKWTFTNYTVKLDLTKIESKIVKQSQKYGTLPTPTRSGYTFDGWYTGENGTGTRVTSDTIVSNASDHTLYAYWTAL